MCQREMNYIQEQGSWRSRWVLGLLAQVMGHFSRKSNQRRDNMSFFREGGGEEVFFLLAVTAAQPLASTICPCDFLAHLIS